jgi:hypothetical protein
VSLDSRGHRSLDEFGSQNEEPENSDNGESEGVFFDEDDSSI